MLIIATLAPIYSMIRTNNQNHVAITDYIPIEKHPRQTEFVRGEKFHNGQTFYVSMFQLQVIECRTYISSYITPTNPNTSNYADVIYPSVRLELIPDLTPPLSESKFISKRG